MEKTATEKLKEWFDDQRENHGLVDIKFFPVQQPCTVEQFAEEVLRMNAAIERGDYTEWVEPELPDLRKVHVDYWRELEEPNER